MTEPAAINAAAIIPQYLDGVGDGTKIILKNGEIIIDKRTTRATTNELASYYATDLVQLRKTYGEFLGQKNVIPLPFTESLILVPFKMRIPRTKNDPAVGHINLCEIKEIRRNRGCTGESIVILNCGVQVPVLHIYRTARNHIMQGERTLERYKKVHGLDNYNMASLVMEVKSMSRMMHALMPAQGAGEG